MKTQVDFRNFSEALIRLIYSQVEQSVNKEDEAQIVISTAIKIKKWIDEHTRSRFSFQAFEDYERKSIKIKSDIRPMKITGESGAVGIYIHPLYHVFWAKDGYISQYGDCFTKRHDRGTNDN